MDIEFFPPEAICAILSALHSNVCPSILSGYEYVLREDSDHYGCMYLCQSCSIEEKYISVPIDSSHGIKYLFHKLFLFWSFSCVSIYHNQLIKERYSTQLRMFRFVFYKQCPDYFVCDTSSPEKFDIESAYEIHRPQIPLTFQTEWYYSGMDHIYKWGGLSYTWGNHHHFYYNEPLPIIKRTVEEKKHTDRQLPKSLYIKKLPTNQPQHINKKIPNNLCNKKLPKNRSRNGYFVRK